MCIIKYSVVILCDLREVGKELATFDWSFDLSCLGTCLPFQLLLHFFHAQVFYQVFLTKTYLRNVSLKIDVVTGGCQVVSHNATDGDGV